MEFDNNENLFQEIRKLQRKVRQIMPVPGSSANNPRHKNTNAATGVPLRRERILRILLFAENGMRQKELADFLCIGAPALSEAVDKLHSDGYIERIPDPGDGRAIRIALTDKGRVRAYEIQDNHKDNLVRLFGNLSNDEKNQMIALLQKIN